MRRVDKDEYDIYETEYGARYQTHGPAKCGNVPGGRKEQCMLHNPSLHHMRDWPMGLDPTKYFFGYRVCPHDYDHPDPDSFSYFVRTAGDKYGDMLVREILEHECDGCCTPPGFLSLIERFEGSADD